MFFTMNNSFFASFVSCSIFCFIAINSYPQASVSLKAHNNKYISAESRDANKLIADRAGAAEWETFVLVPLTGNQVALRAHNGMYVSADETMGGRLIANRYQIKAWETFTMLNLGSHKITLQAHNGRFVCADEGDGSKVIANRTASAEWETFTIDSLRYPPLIFITYNLALLPIAPATSPGFFNPYLGRDREGVLRSLISNIRLIKPDVIGLCEVFVDGEKRRIKEALRDTYPYAIEGPDEGDLESDGGLLLLSVYPFLQSHQTIYRTAASSDMFSNKGALHARIDFPRYVAGVDVFYTHVQAPIGGSAREVIQKQLDHLSSFVQACRDWRQPAVLMGDFNTDGFDPVIYNDMLARLGNPADIWTAARKVGLFNYRGITEDPLGTLNRDSRSITDASRYVNGKRSDYIFCWPGRNYQSVLGDVEVLTWQSGSGMDISDHYGLYGTINNIRDIRTDRMGEIRHLSVELAKIQCLEVTKGSDLPCNAPDLPGDRSSDGMIFKMGFLASTGITRWIDETVKYEMTNGKTIFPSRSRDRGSIIELDNPGDWIDIKVNGREWDFIGDDDIGTQTLRLHISDLWYRPGNYVEWGIPLFTGDCSQYVAVIKVRADYR